MNKKISGCTNRIPNKRGLGFIPCHNCMLKSWSKECEDYRLGTNRIQTEIEEKP